MREAQFRTTDHRDQLPSGAAMLVHGTAMDDLIHRLHFGDPTLGWEGDPRLALAFNRQTDRWELWRMEHDGEYRLVCVSKAGVGFPPDLIKNLMSMDGQRGYNLVQDLDRNRQVAEAAKDYTFHQTMAPKIQKLAWGLRKDLAV